MATKTEAPDTKVAQLNEPIKVSCDVCATFLFGTYYDPTRVDVRCRKCRDSVVVKVEGGQVTYKHYRPR